MNKKRLLIFIAFSFGLVWGMDAIAYGAGVKYESNAMQLVMALSMFGPVVAMLLTRLITKEGFRNMGFGICLKGKAKYYLLAAIIPVLYTEIGWIIYYLVDRASFDGSGMMPGENYLLPLTALVSALLYSSAAMGEEAGWRGYMYPKLEECFGCVGACLIGGTIWAVWHYPLLVQGHNFGTDYFGYPYLGCLVFIPYCIGVGAIQWYLTQKTKSVWPAAILHSINNAYSASGFFSLAMKDFDASLYKNNRLLGGLLLTLPAILTGFAFLIMMGRKHRKTN